MEIKFDFDALQAAANTLVAEKQKLEDLNTEVQDAKETLRAKGWRGKGEEAFEEIIEDQLGTMMEAYAGLMSTLSNILETVVIAEYENLVEEAKALKFPQ